MAPTTGQAMLNTTMKVLLSRKVRRFIVATTEFMTEMKMVISTFWKR
jgi:hypothetical protein